MTGMQRAGGIAALTEAATFVVGFALFATLIADADYGNLDVDPAEHVEFLVSNETTMYAWHLVIYVLFGAALVVLALALHDRLSAASPVLARVATAFGLIWAGLVIASGMVANIGAAVVTELSATDPARAESTWLALRFVVDGLGGGNEIVGGLWMLLVSWAALRTARLPRALAWSGVVVSLAGVVTVAPPLGEVGGALFGLGSIVWFTWIGVVLLRREVPTERAALAGSSVTSSVR